MKINQVTIRNYRVHRVLSIGFDASRNLIGGPNEAGKSTVAEAIHRALFMKARGKSDYHREMQSDFLGGDPEVEIEFEARGVTYHLSKRFSANGRVRLHALGSEPIHGAQAEEELANVLNADNSLKGKSQLAQWRHLWVWQGSSSSDPMTTVSDQHSNLVRRLQEIGSEAILQSDLDTAIARGFAEELEQILTRSGEPKAGSDLKRIITDLDMAEQELKLAIQRSEKLDQAHVSLETASKAQAQAAEVLVALRTEMAKVQESLERTRLLREEEKRQNIELATAENVLRNFRADVQKLQSLTRTIEALTEKVASQESTAKSHQEEASLAAINLIEKGKELRAIRDEASRTRSEAELALDLVRRNELMVRTLKFEQTMATIEQLESTERACRGEISQLPQVERDLFSRLRSVQTDAAVASATVEAMGASLEVVTTDQPISLNDISANVGSRHVLTEPTQVRIGEGVLIRIAPGGGASLIEAQRRFEDLSQELTNLLSSIGVASVDEAQDALSQREELARTIDRCSAEIQGLNPGDTERELYDLKHELDALTASCERRLNAEQNDLLSFTLQQATTMRQANLAELRRLEDEENVLQIVWDECHAKQKSFESLLKNAQAELQELKDQLRDNKVEARLLGEALGDDASRTSMLAAKEASVALAKSALERVKLSLQMLEPDSLEPELERLQRAIKQKDLEIGGLRDSIIRFKTELMNDGCTDPKAAVEVATCHHQRILGMANAVRRDIEATQLLNQLFADEQKELAIQFTQPLADKIRDYMQVVFGTDASVSLDIEPSCFSNLTLSRSSIPFRFDKLSNGTREQVAAAVRLAMAEVLAADHDGTLPLVFDDAFACSDPDRLRSLQRMLDLAARRGLQIIVLTCNPNEYAGLGANCVLLDRDSNRRSSASCPVVSVDQKCETTASA